MGGGHHSHVITGGAESKFGIDWERVKDVGIIAKRGKLKIVGVHCHIGSGVLDAQLFVTAVSNLLSIGTFINSSETILREAKANLLVDNEEIIKLNAGINLMLHTASREITGKICSFGRFISTSNIAVIETATIAIISKKSLGV